MDDLYLKYLKSLSVQFPTIAKASTEMINLQARLNLPKETEHFVSDIHGEYEQFLHILRNGSGAIRNKIEDVFGSTLSQKDKKSLAALIYYPEQKVEQMKLHLSQEDLLDWYKVSLHRLVAVCKESSAKYTRSRLPAELVYAEPCANRSEALRREAIQNGLKQCCVPPEEVLEKCVAALKLAEELIFPQAFELGMLVFFHPCSNFGCKDTTNI